MLLNGLTGVMRRWSYNARRRYIISSEVSRPFRMKSSIYWKIFTLDLKYVFTRANE